ncbi:MAG TPA: ATP-binding protein [Myxococcales bacterium]|nr:ATP-binding protein [Myxococcales bacterium]
MGEAATTDVPRERVGGRYRVLAFRGGGGEGSVYLAEDLLTGDEVALKVGPANRIAAEYARSAPLEHPHLARAIALWPDGGLAALSLEFASHDFTELRGSTEGVIVQHVAGIARALACLHRRGIVHADVKPQNALLAGAKENRRALLADLGLAGAGPTSRGSLEYAAPEVLEGGAPSVASDLYSLGVTLHELLSGANPFARARPSDVVRAHFELPPPVKASPGVQAIVAKLLSRDPHSRYAHADEVIEALAAATGSALELEGEGLALDCLGLGELRGRDDELARFQLAVVRTRSGNGTQLLVAGPKGAGKSRLLRRFKIAAELAGMRVLQIPAGRGLDVLCAWLGILLDEDGPSAPTVALAQRRLATVAERGPLAVLLEDADVDPGLRALVGAVARAPACNARPLLLVAAAREPIDPALGRIELRPLPSQIAKAKLAEILGTASWAEQLAGALVREVSGAPAELEDAVRDLATRGILRRSRGRWQLDVARAGRDFEGCLPLQSLRAARHGIRAFPEQVRTALGVASVLGPDFERSALVACAGEQAASALLSAGILESAGTRLRFPRLALMREAERALDTKQRREAHALAVEWARDVSRRALHLFRSGMRGSVRASLAAARTRLREGAPAEAARLYQIACAALRTRFADRRAALICERAADCLALAGRLAAARFAYARALARGGEAGRLWQKIAKLRWQESRFEQVLEALSRARVAGGDALAISVVEARAQAMLGNYERARALAAEALPLARSRGDAESATRLHHVIGTCAWHTGDGRGAALAERAAVLIARRHGDRRAEADARAGLSTAYRLLAQYRRAAAEAARAIELYVALGDERQEGLAWNNLGVARYLAGEWEGALEAWEKLAGRTSRTVEEELVTLNNLAYLYRERGDFPRAKDLLRRALARIGEVGGYARLDAMVRGNLGEVAAREGDFAAAESLLQETKEVARRIDARDELLETERRLAELQLLRRDPSAAVQRASEALAESVRAGNRVEQGNLLRVVALAARATGDAAAASAAVQQARAVLQQAGAPLELARVECVGALVELDCANLVQAEAALRRARSTFEKLGAAPDLREIEQLQGEIEVLQRKSLSQVEALTRAAQRLAASSDPAALLEEVLDQALQLTGAQRGFILLNEGSGAPRIAAVRGADADATLRISRTVADRVLNSGELVAVADIVGRQELSAQKSILDLGLRSVLCAPIRSGGKQLGILYVDSRRVGVLLSEKDLGLLSAFAALAGSALENARLIDDLRRRGDLLAHMAHEFRSPLVSIKGYADLMRDEPSLGQRPRADLDVISEQAQRLSNLVNRTLELARMEAGAMKLSCVPVSLVDVVQAAMAGLKPIALMKSISVSVSAAEDARPVLGDFDRLVQVVTNLVGNAIHYSSTGKRVWVDVRRGDPLPPLRAPRIEVEGAPPSSGGPRPRPSTRISVKDEGPGIAPASLEKLFTPFFRAGTKKTVGTGLGLVITRELVRQQGGDIAVESELGRGTTFTVVLPEAP